ncbi:MAG: site-2 protease family protein [Planctomycetes bacterium]|jgi:Zn-dependent protease|nr:site-2 protease family protein [Planctomycetota bacterium]MCL4728876.1 site-2 protease family protein [Planctomycetota bacterium]
MNWLAVSLGEGAGTKLVAGMIAWFLQMGFHEGGHAYAAYWLGDPTAHHLGKRTVNPFRHVNWNDPFSVISSVVMPAVTVLTLGFPLGMAWVPVNPSNFRHPLRDHAIVAFAGPAGGFVVAAIVLALYLVLFPLMARLGAQPAQLLQLLFVMTYLTAIVYSVFNLVPIPPLDGSNILYYLGNENLRALMDRIRPFGFFIIIVVFWIFNGGVILEPAIRALLWPLIHLPGEIWGG